MYNGNGAIGNMKLLMSISLVAGLVIGAWLFGSLVNAAGNPTYFGGSLCSNCVSSYNPMLSLAQAGKIDMYYQKGYEWTKFNPKTSAFEPVNSLPRNVTSIPDFQDPLNSANNFVGQPSQGQLNKISQELSGRVAPSDALQPNQLGPDGPSHPGPTQQDPTICIVPRPGQSLAFGPITDDHPIGGGTIDLAAPVWPIPESRLNFALRTLGSATMEIELAQAGSQKVEKGKVIMRTPTQEQAMQYVASMGGNTSNRGWYKIGGTDVPVGKYVANQRDDKTGIVFDKECLNPRKEAARDPKADPFASPEGENNFGGNPNGGGNGGGGNPGGPLSMLQAMQGLFGSLGKNQFGNQNNQNPYGAGYGNQQQNQCASQSTSPVCGTDGKNYKNECYLQQLGVALKNTGVCVAALAISPINSAAVLTQVPLSGIPASLVNDALNAVAAVLSNLTANTITPETVVK